jgi:C4-dicarboxylate-specific signal transduction histidine kinase
MLLTMGSVVPFAAQVRHGQLLVPWSSALRQLFGVGAARRGWRGGPLFNTHVVVEDRAGVQAAVDQLIQHGERMEIRYRVRDGELQRCLQVCAVRTERGSRVIGVFKDCTAATLVERQRQLTHERLQSMGRLTLLGEVASGLAHELNQPLAAMATFAYAGERLLSLPEPQLEKAREVFREVSQQALRAGDIIRHMRSLIKRRAAQPELIAAEALMRDFLTLAEPMARASHVQLVTRIETAGREVSVDVTQINQAMMILFQNALEATRQRAADDGQVRVVLVAGDSGLEWSVEDQGPGVNDSVAAQMFQPFFSTKDNGTGLGLISCRNMLEAHGCRLSYVNLVDGGCRFWFELPYPTVPASASSVRDCRSDAVSATD